MNHFREIITILLFLFVISFKGNQIIAHEHGYSTKEYNNTMKWGSKKKKKKKKIFIFVHNKRLSSKFIFWNENKRHCTNSIRIFM